MKFHIHQTLLSIISDQIRLVQYQSSIYSLAPLQFPESTEAATPRSYRPVVPYIS